MVVVLPDSGHRPELEVALRLAPHRSTREEPLSTTMEDLGLYDEPTIDELLSDPVAQSIMRYDGIDADVVRRVMAQAEQRMRAHDRAA